MLEMMIPQWLWSSTTRSEQQISETEIQVIMEHRRVRTNFSSDTCRFVESLLSTNKNRIPTPRESLSILEKIQFNNSSNSHNQTEERDKQQQEEEREIMKHKIESLRKWELSTNSLTSQF